MPPLPDYDDGLVPRLTLLFRIESLINVGCTYGPGDLEPATWDHLLMLASERQFVDRVLDKRRDKTGRDEEMHAKARAQTGLPAPGGSLFPSTARPFKSAPRR